MQDEEYECTKCGDTVLPLDRHRCNTRIPSTKEFNHRGRPKVSDMKRAYGSPRG